MISKLSEGNYRRISRGSGLSHQHVSKVLRGLSGCTVETGSKIADAAGVSLQELAGHMKEARRELARNRPRNTPVATS